MTNTWQVHCFHLESAECQRRTAEGAQTSLTWRVVVGASSKHVTGNKKRKLALDYSLKVNVSACRITLLLTASAQTWMRTFPFKYLAVLFALELICWWWTAAVTVRGKEVLLRLHLIQTARRQNISDQQHCGTQVFAIKAERALSHDALCCRNFCLTAQRGSKTHGYISAQLWPTREQTSLYCVSE